MIESQNPVRPPRLATQRARPLTPVTHDVGAGSAAGRVLKPRRGGRTGWTYDPSRSSHLYSVSTQSPPSLPRMAWHYGVADHLEK